MEISTDNCGWMAVVSDVMGPGGAASVGITDSTITSGFTEG